MKYLFVITALLFASSSFAAVVKKVKSNRFLVVFDSAEKDFIPDTGDDVIIFTSDEDEYDGYVRKKKRNMAWISCQYAEDFQAGDKVKILIPTEDQMDEPNMTRPVTHKYNWELGLSIGSHRFEISDQRFNGSNVEIKAIYRFPLNSISMGIGPHLRSSRISYDEITNPFTGEVIEPSLDFFGAGLKLEIAQKPSPQFQIYAGIVGDFYGEAKSEIKVTSPDGSEERALSESVSIQQTALTIGVNYIARDVFLVGLEYTIANKIKAQTSDDYWSPAIKSKGTSIYLGWSF